MKIKTKNKGKRERKRTVGTKLKLGKFKADLFFCDPFKSSLIFKEYLVTSVTEAQTINPSLA